MDLSLLHAGLAAGAALAAIPLILHLVMRQTPRVVVFPALRLLQNRHRQSTRRLRVKNWLLLLARMALLALMALALARPALHSTVPIGDANVPTALGLVIDTSLSMEYTDQGKTRLDQAKDVAREILKGLPETSQVFVVDSGVAGVPAGISPSAARKRIDGLALRAANRSLNAGVEDAYSAIADSRPDLARREVYVLTDLARSSWDTGQPVGRRTEAEEKLKQKISTFVIRVSPKEVKGVGIASVEATPVAGESAADAGAYEVRARLRAIGPETSRTAELFVDGKLRDRKSVAIPANGQVEVAFAKLPSLAEGLHQGEVRLPSTDPSTFDDRRYVSFLVRPGVKVLLLYDEQAGVDPRSIDAFFVANALDPYGFGKPYQVELLPASRTDSGFAKPLAQYAFVVMNNVERLSDAAWGQLGTYLREGGGLVVGLGRRAEAANYGGAAAARILPGVVGEPRQPPGGTRFGQVVEPGHPLFQAAARELAADLAAVPVSSYSLVTPDPTSRILLRYQDGAPALLERTIPGTGNGRVLMWTTPLSRRPQLRDPDAWNEFASGRFWSFVALMDATASYLSGQSGLQLNHEAGDDVALPLDVLARAPSYAIQGPDGKASERLSVPANVPALLVQMPQEIGNWSVTPSNAGGDPRSNLGFSLNPPVSELTFTPLEESDLTRLFGAKDRYALADSPDQLDRTRSIERVGRELFPWLMVLILVLITLESFLANRFHKQAGEGAAKPRVSAIASVTSRGREAVS